LHLQARQAGGQAWSCTVDAVPGENPAIASVWARSIIRDLEDRYATGEEDHRTLEKQIVQISLRHGVLSRFTAYVALDTSEAINPGGERHRIVQPVELPAGWTGREQRYAQASTLACRRPHAHMEYSCMMLPSQLAVAPKRGARRKAAAAPPLDLAPYRSRVGQWLSESAPLDKAGPDELPGRLAEWGARLGELVADLKSVGAAISERSSLEALWQELLALLATADPPQAKLAELAARVQQVLKAFALGAASPPAPPRRKFWA
jgi:Ca-activated chloride channel family protein